MSIPRSLQMLLVLALLSTNLYCYPESKTKPLGKASEDCILIHFEEDANLADLNDFHDAYITVPAEPPRKGYNLREGIASMASRKAVDAAAFGVAYQICFVDTMPQTDRARIVRDFKSSSIVRSIS